MASTPASMLAALQSGRRLTDESVLYELFQALIGARTMEAGDTAPGPALTTFYTFVNGGGDFVSLPPALPGRQLQCMSGPLNPTPLTVTPAAYNPANGGAPDQIILVGSWQTYPTVAQDEGAPTLYVCYQLGTWIQITL